MSKSLGNVIQPSELVDRYGTDATRYMLLRHVHPTDDSDVTWERLDEWYTANLVNGLGNLVARIMKMASTHLSAPVEVLAEVQADQDIAQSVEDFEFNHALDKVWECIGRNDELITLSKPFVGVKSDNAEVQKEALLIIEKLVRELHTISVDLKSFMPETAGIIEDAIKENKKPDNLFNRLEA